MTSHPNALHVTLPLSGSTDTMASFIGHGFRHAGLIADGTDYAHGFIHTATGTLVLVHVTPLSF